MQKEWGGKEEGVPGRALTVASASCWSASAQQQPQLRSQPIRFYWRLYHCKLTSRGRSLSEPTQALFSYSRQDSRVVNDANYVILNYKKDV